MVSKDAYSTGLSLILWLWLSVSKFFLSPFYFDLDKNDTESSGADSWSNISFVSKAYNDATQKPQSLANFDERSTLSAEIIKEANPWPDFSEHTPAKDSGTVCTLMSSENSQISTIDFSDYLNKNKEIEFEVISEVRNSKKSPIQFPLNMDIVNNRGTKLLLFKYWHKV